MTSYNYFKDSELACKHCGEQKMDHDFMKKIDELRHELGFPFIVTSAYRCPTHNSSVSATGANGPHTTGKAIDIRVSHENAYKLLVAAAKEGFTGIGVNQRGNYRFIHLDMIEDEGIRPRVWSY